MLLSSATFQMGCKGRDNEQNAVFGDQTPISISFRILENEKTVAINVDCPFNKGSHREYCTASTNGELDIDRYKRVLCPYNTSIS